MDEGVLEGIVVEEDGCMWKVHWVLVEWVKGPQGTMWPDGDWYTSVEWMYVCRQCINVWVYLDFEKQ